MTEEADLAIDWIRSQGWNEENLPSDELLQMEQAFLAGLKAGKDMAEADLATVAYMQGAERYRPKWHDLRKDPNDLPKKDERFCTNISVAVLTQSCGFAFYSFDDNKWYFSGKVIDVIAWCEIPKFEENE